MAETVSGYRSPPRPASETPLTGDEERERLAAVHRYGILDTPPDETFDRIAAMAARLLQVPIASITLVDEDRIWFKASHGLDGVTEVPREPGLCSSAILADDTYVISDAVTDPRAADNPLVRGELGLRFYAAAPLVTADGHRLGTVNVVDRQPRQLADDDLETLRDLAAVVVDALELRRAGRAVVSHERDQLRRWEQLQGLAAATRRVTAATSVPDALQLITEQARTLVGAHQGITSLTVNDNWVQGITASSLSLRYAAWRGYDASTDGSGIYSEVCRENRPMRLTQAELEAHPAWRGFGSHAGQHPPMRGWLAVPLISHAGRNLGLVQLSDKYDDAEFDEADEAILVQLAQLASVAIQKDQLLEQQRHIAHTLQQSLLPPSLPAIPGIDLAARYHPSGDGNEVGGDFYDVFETARGDWALVIGDVCGKGPEAAAVTALTRHTARAAAMSDRDPAAILAVLNGTVRKHSTARFCTLLYLRLQFCEAYPCRLTVASAGHPLPLVIRPDGQTSELGVPGTLLGVLPELAITSHTLDLAYDHTVVLYTDGVTEAHRPRGPQFGDAGFHGVLAAHRREDVDDLAQAVLAGALEHQQGRAHDDIATLVLRRSS